MPTILKTKNSVTTTVVPTTLQQGELAVNITDKKVWVGNAATTPVQLLGDGGSGSFTSIAFGAGTVSAPSITFTGDTNTGIYSPAADTIAFTEGGVESMRINSSGNVGINTTNPTAKLYITTAANSSGLVITDATSSDFSVIVGASSGIVNVGSPSAGMAFTTVNTERMRINTSGNVMIGANTIDSGFRLNVEGGGIYALKGASGTAFQTSNLTSADFSIATTSGGVSNIGTSGNALAFTTGSERMRIDSSGRVGIGTSSPVNPLQVAGVIGSTSVGSANTGINGAFLYYNASNNAVFGSGNASAVSGTLTPIIFEQSNQVQGLERMRIDASGNVGIGTSSPNARLEVLSSTAGAEVSRFEGNYTGSGSVVLTNWRRNGGAVAAAMKYSDDNPFGMMFGTTTSHAQIFMTADTERMRITSNGVVLIGTTNESLNAGVGIKFRPDTTAKQISVVSAESTNGGGETYVAYSTGASAYRFYVGWGGTVYATSATITSLSDQRLKENIVDLNDGLDSVMALKPRRFDWKAGKGKDIKGDRGFIAQEFETVFPDMVEESKDQAPEGEEPYKAVNANLIPTLVKAIQEQQALIENLTTRLNALEGK